MLTQVGDAQIKNNHATVFERMQLEAQGYMLSKQSGEVNVNLDEYLWLYNYVRDNMEHPEWLGDFSKEDFSL